MPRYSPAALRLAAVGITHNRIAAKAGVARPTVSLQLNGTATPKPYLFKAISTLGGPALSAEIAEILGVEVSA